MRPTQRMAIVVLAAATAACAEGTWQGRVEATETGGIAEGPVDSAATAMAETSAVLDVGGASRGRDASDLEGESGCTEAMVAVQPIIPTIVLLVDQSASMEEPFGGVSRWDALYQTLMGDAGIVRALESRVRFGLTLYSSVDGFIGGECPMLTDVAPALGNFAAIDAVYAAAVPIDETPTGESLAFVAADLDAFAAPGPKAIVLATDGEPDTCAMPNPQSGQPQSLAAVVDAFAAGITTYAISVGTEIAEAHLQTLANAGVGKAADDPDPAPFYVALDAGDLVGAFEAIIGGVISCTLPIDAVVELDAACDGTLLLDDTALACPDDWTMTDESTIELLGDACATWKDGQSHAVEASWPCGSVSIP